MQRVGVKELKQRATEFVRRVREDRESFEITLRGEVVAQLGPPRQNAFDPEAWIRETEDLARKIGEEWQGPPDAVEAVREGRRN
jgi:antitoxin (DNA-binding transcriptional repressor) of toxin-antitoxin stability system